MSKRKFEIVKRETLFQGYFRVDRYHVRHERFGGGWSGVYNREVLERGARVVAVLLFDPRHDKIIMVEQFRVPVMARDDNPWNLELVAGVVDPGETPETAARREAREEAGCEIAELQKLFSCYLTPGSSSEHITIYIGRAEAPEDGGVFGVEKENEDIRVCVMDAAKAIGMLYDGTLRDAASIIAMQWFATRHTELRSRWLVSDASTPII